MFSAAHYNKYIISQLCGFHCIYACRPGQADLLDQVNFKLRMGQKGDLSDFNCVMVLLPDGRVSVFQFVICRDFPTQPSLGFIANDPKQRKYPASSRSLSKNSLLTPEVREEDCFQTPLEEKE